MLHWQLSSFTQLSHAQMCAIFALRQDVFIVEQHCIYQDIDGLDLNAQHLLGYHNNKDNEKQLVAYARILAAGIKYTEIAIGRVVVAPTYRGQGIGLALMRTAIEQLNRRHHYPSIRISAQQHLLKFYQQLGFHAVSAPYDEDGISHVEMLLSPAIDSEAVYE